MAELIRYEAARAALAEAKRIDEVFDIKNKAIALDAYARQAKDPELVNLATDIRLRAERRAGELLIAMERNGERQPQARPKINVRDVTMLSVEPEAPPQTLKELGISPDQSSRWQGIAKMPENQFEERVAQMKRLATQTVTMTPFERAQEKKTKRATREQELGARQRALPDAKYGVILADPPWSFEVYSRETGMDRAADNHYPTQSLVDIQDLEVEAIAADDCVLFLWATAPMVPQALGVMDTWGFTYKSHCIWLKDKAGTGYWFRNKHELLLVGTRGKIVAPAPGTQCPSAIEATVGKHSEKPEIFLTMIEELFPTVPKIELNRRGPAREGWSVWGNETE